MELLQDSRQPTRRVRSAKPAWSKDVCTSCMCRDMFSTTSKYSDTEHVWVVLAQEGWFEHHLKTGLAHRL